MSNRKIPCTVQVLTHNSVATIRRNLDSLRDFGEVIVQDGNSTDGTRDIVREYPNARLIDQDPRFLDANGFITDFSSMRNISIFSAKYDWLFPEDADEYLSQESIEEIRSIVARGVPGVYKVFRRFFVEGDPVIHCSGYPATQIRLFHRSCTPTGYRKPVHELLTLHSGVTVQMLQSDIPIPLPSASSLYAKYRRYIYMECRRQRGQTILHWARYVLFRSLRSAFSVSVRTAWIWCTPRKGKRMPLAYEWQAVWYALSIILWTFPPLNHSPDFPKSVGSSVSDPSR